MPAERLQKLLARAGLGSRRSAEQLIRDGRVTVDGAVATLGQRADSAQQRIVVDGRPLPSTSADVVIALHKPSGYLVAASDGRGRPTVYELLDDPPPNLRYVGRLDFNTEGLLLMTTDGELAHRLAHPRYHVEKVYEATVVGRPPAEVLERLRRGIDLDDGRTAPATVEVIYQGRSEQPTSTLRITIHEGRRRQVRRMCEAVGHPVRQLVRVAVGPVRLGHLPRARSRRLTDAEERSLRILVGLVDAPE